jgi:hypothetical protein
MTTTTVVARAALVAIGDAIVLAGQTVAAYARKVFRAAHAAITVTRRHVPAWVGVALSVALAIPGPIDELIVLVLIAGFAAFKPQMRADFARTVPQAWKGEK